MLETMELILQTQVGKQWIKDTSKQIIEACNEGEIDTLELLAKMKAIATVFDNVRDGVMQLAIKAVLKYGKEAKLHGCTLTVAEAGTKFDFSPCKNQSWEELKRKESEFAAERKRIETLLKKHIGRFSTDAEVIDEESGEVLMVEQPPIKTSTTIVQVKIES